MKKLFTIIAFCIVNTVALQAQDNKPTKEETIAFMERTLKSGLGLRARGTIFGEVADVSFSEDAYYVATTIKSFNSYSGFQWEYLNADEFYVQGGEDDPEPALYIWFNKRFHLKSKIGKNPEEEELVTKFIVFIPKNKIESFKKACIRLSEIAKEENKDPFAN